MIINKETIARMAINRETLQAKIIIDKESALQILEDIKNE